MKRNSEFRINLVTGGAGFIGSHLVDKLINNNEKVICLDNFFTGRKKNIAHLIEHPNFQLIQHDVTEPLDIQADRIWHLACPASPTFFQENPIKTSKINFLGTYNLLNLASKLKARFLFASSSEIYGNPKLHPQKESYFGNVNPIGVRSCYDEGKRMAESLCTDYVRMYRTDIRIARIFNTYGTRMSKYDGRVISNFINQALNGDNLTIYGDGSQTRSFCYIDDLINGLMLIMDNNYYKPINIGNPYEVSILELAELIIKKINPRLKFDFYPLPDDDPFKRKPNVGLAMEELSWEPKINLNLGLEKTINYFRKY